jgi:hypothetical protein
MSIDDTPSDGGGPHGADHADRARSVYERWLRARVDKELDAVPDRLWHYTNAGGMKGIFDSGSLWATNTAFLNDSSEFSYGVGMFIAALEKVNSTDLHPMTCSLITGLVEHDGGVLRQHLLRTVSLYVACFCEAENLLSQWRAYTGANTRSGAYALGFATKSPHGWIQSCGHGLRLRQVIYDPVEQQKVCAELVDGLVSVLDRAPDELAVQNAFARCLEDGVIDFASSCKHPDFSEEKEWRVIYQRATDRDPLPVRFRTAEGILVPYVELELPEPTGAHAGRLPVREVQIGPIPDLDRTWLGLQMFLDSHGQSITITGSRTPAH